MSESKRIQRKSPLLHWLNAYLPPLIWAGVIFVISNQQMLPGTDVFIYDFLLKKSAHMFVYAIFYWLVYRGVQLTTSKASLFLHWTLPLVVCLIYAVSDEIHQSFVPGRYATLRDIGYDMVGAGVVFLKKYQYI